MMFPNDADGNALKPIYTPIFRTPATPWSTAGPFQNGTEDYTPQIAEFKKAGAEIGIGIFIPPDFTNFWKQAAQQGWKPKIATYTKVLLFPQSVEALGAIANQLDAPRCGGRPNHPFKSAVLEQTCKEFAADFEADREAAVDAAAVALPGLRLGCRRPQAHHERRRQGSHRQRPSRAPT